MTYPKVLQLPLTLKCNSKCVMCNVWNMNHDNEMSVQEFSVYMKDAIFSKVEAVGINGGEPTLIDDLELYVDEILKLPRLRSLNIISNGYKKERLTQICRYIYAKCKLLNILFHISISLDGFGDTHDNVRGIKGAFPKTIATIEEVKENQHLYCDSFDLGCTVMNQNVDNLIELDTYAISKQYDIKYRLAIENKRIESDKLTKQFSVLYNANMQSAKEFFHYKMMTERDSYAQFKYFSIFYWIDSVVKKRLLGCAWQKEGMTLDSKGNLYYCAVESNQIGTLREKNGETIFFDQRNLEYRDLLIQNKCNGCIHDYSGEIPAYSKVIFQEYMMRVKRSMDIYKIKASIL